MMVMPVARLNCPVCRSGGLVFAFESHSGKDRCLCGRCGLIWIAPDPAAVAQMDAAMILPPRQRPCTSTVIGTYTYTN